MPRAAKYPAVAPSALPASPRDLFIGTSGWAYTSWKPGFYPPEVPARAFLQYYSSRFNTVEVNHTFRAIPERETVQSWVDATPRGFRFAFKASEQITHRRRLLNCDEHLSIFLEAIRPAREAGKLAALLFQLPPNFKADLGRLSGLLKSTCLGSGTERPPIAIEFRNASWFTEQTYAVLREHSAALCVADSDDLETPDVPTAPFRYYRFRQSGGYSARKLNVRAKQLLAAAHDSEVFAFLKHEDEPTGALNALHLLRAANAAERQQGAEA